VTPTELVAAELASLCYRAGVAPEDASDFAARRVCAQVEEELRTSRGGVTDWVNCPVQEWLRRKLPAVVSVVGDSLVTLPREVTAGAVSPAKAIQQRFRIAACVGSLRWNVSV
jgi:hypothetical protein